jgi:hypothetical protein
LTYELNHTEVAEHALNALLLPTVLVSGPARLKMVLADKCLQIVGTRQDFDS